jgi:hypothetical protein
MLATNWNFYRKVEKGEEVFDLFAFFLCFFDLASLRLCGSFFPFVRFCGSLKVFRGAYILLIEAAASLICRTIGTGYANLKKKKNFGCIGRLIVLIIPLILLFCLSFYVALTGGL